MRKQPLEKIPSRTAALLRFLALACLTGAAGYLTLVTLGQTRTKSFLRQSAPMGLYGPVAKGSFVRFAPAVAAAAGNGSRVLITGAAGFIGFHTASRLATLGVEVLGLDDFNGYYSPALKRARAERLEATHGVKTLEGDVCDGVLVADLLRRFAPTHVLHLAAQPGVRYSLKHPQVYVRANVQCFVTLLDALVLPAAQGGPAVRPYLVYASSSSVYGANTKSPFAESDRVDMPTNLYGATKRSNEQTAFAYWQLHGLRSVGCRFFTVYGPWGRPDMAVFSFADKMDKGQPLTLFNGGSMNRDFTYVDDIVDGIVKVLEWRSEGGTPQVFNLGRTEPVPLRAFVASLERALGTTATVLDGGPSKGEVDSTASDGSLSRLVLGFSPHTSLDQGLLKFAAWYRSDDRKPDFSQVAA